MLFAKGMAHALVACLVCRSDLQVMILQTCTQRTAVNSTGCPNIDELAGTPGHLTHPFQKLCLCHHNPIQLMFPLNCTYCRCSLCPPLPSPLSSPLLSP